MRVWDAATGQCLATLGHHGEPVTCVAWFPDGRRLATGGHDKQVGGRPQAAPAWLARRAPLLPRPSSRPSLFLCSALPASQLCVVGIDGSVKQASAGEGCAGQARVERGAARLSRRLRRCDACRWLAAASAASSGARAPPSASLLLRSASARKTGGQGCPPRTLGTQERAC